jgi:hypothetical protein
VSFRLGVGLCAYTIFYGNKKTVSWPIISDSMAKGYCKQVLSAVVGKHVRLSEAINNV